LSSIIIKPEHEKLATLEKSSLTMLLSLEDSKRFSMKKTGSNSSQMQSSHHTAANAEVKPFKVSEIDTSKLDERSISSTS
jgi:hypothetical protein